MMFVSVAKQLAVANLVGPSQAAMRRGSPSARPRTKTSAGHVMSATCLQNERHCRSERRVQYEKHQNNFDGASRWTIAHYSFLRGSAKDTQGEGSGERPSD